MLVAKQKRKENIAEYIIYMWQIEDTVRACSFDMDKVEERIISQYNQPPKVIDEIRNWYTDIIVMMHEENIQNQGHLKLLQSLIDDLYDLHKKLLFEKKDDKYTELFTWALPNIQAFRENLKDEAKNDIDICFHALYSLLLLRLQKKSITNETEQAMQTFSNLLASLAQKFKEKENGMLEL